MRFIHTADWHLGRIFHGHHLTDDQAGLLQNFLYMVTDTQAEAVILAGDVYDRAVPPVEAVALFDEVLAKLLLEKKVPVLLVAGNHDSAERLGFGRRLLAGQGLFVRGPLSKDLSPVILDDAYGSIAFQLYPYMEPAMVRAVFSADCWDFDTATGQVIEAGKKTLPSGIRRVAVAHAFLAGGQATDSERPLSVGGSSYVDPHWFQDFHYTALGHLHHAQQAGRETIRYSGSLMKYSFDEAHQEKSITLVDMAADGTCTTELLPLHPKRDVCVIRGYFDEILKDRQRYPIQEDYVSVALLDTVPILDAHGRLKRIYPNLMQIERPALLQMGEKPVQGLSAENRQKSEVEIFADFYKEMTGEALSEAQRTTFIKSAEEVYRLAREVRL